jgi:hypothetical protein
MLAFWSAAMIDCITDRPCLKPELAAAQSVGAIVDAARATECVHSLAQTDAMNVQRGQMKSKHTEYNRLKQIL